MQVVSVGFAPVKNTRHLSYDAVTLDAHGPVGDRDFCLIGADNHKVLKTVPHRALLAVSARWDGSSLSLTLPSGEIASGVPVPSGESVTCHYWGRSVTHQLTDGPHSGLLSAYLGKSVRLTIPPRGGGVYGASVSILNLASLRDLGERTGRTDLLDTTSRFRMTMVVDTGDEPYVEETWLGRELQIGDAVVTVAGPIGRCGVIDLDPVTGEKDGSLLKALAGYRPTTGGEPWFGVDAHVVTPGVVRLMDHLSVSH
jgi:uncharacterized protein YcbX